MVHNVLLTEVRLIILVKEYLLFICLFVVVVGAFQGKRHISIGGRFSPTHPSLSTLYI